MRLFWGWVMTLGLATMTAHAITLTDGTMTVRINEQGHIVGVTVAGKALKIQPSPLPVSLRVDDKWWHDELPPITPVAIERQRKSASITVRIADFVLTIRYALVVKGVLQKSVALRYDGNETLKIDGVLFLLPAVALDGKAVVLSPSFDFLRVPIQQRPRFNIDMGTGAWCALYSKSQKLGVAALFYSDTEHFSVNAETIKVSGVGFSGFGFRVFHWLGVQDRVQKGWTAELGTQFFIVAKGSEHDLLSRFWDANEAIGVRTLTDTPCDVFDGAVYSTWSNYPNLRRLLPHLKRLGVKTIWLLPYTPGVYAPLDYYAIRPEVGTADDLKSLVAEAHKLGMRILLDLIPHGPRPESELSKQRPEWICRDEQGRFIYWWGCFAFDYAHEGWRRYMAELAGHFAKEFGVDGWRVDVAGGGPANWAVTKEKMPRRRPSQSGLWGGLRILDESRAAVKEARGDAIFYPEASGPPFVAHGDIVYEFPLLFVLRRLPNMDASEFVTKLRLWLQHQRYTFPKGGTKRLVRFLENHDFPNAQQVFGIAPAKALFALIASLEGIPFLFEDEDVGATPFIERVMKLRSALPELRDGDADYLVTQVNPDTIFAVYRFTKRHHSVVLVNISSEPMKVKVKLPQPIAKWKQVGDAWTGKVYAVRNGTVTLTLSPYEPAFLTDATRAVRFTPAPIHPFTPARLSPSLSDDGILQIGDALIGQWREGEFKVAPGEREMMEAMAMSRTDDAVEGKTTLKRRIGAVTSTVAVVKWRWQRDGNKWCYEANWQPVAKIKLARHDLSWQFTFAKPLRWHIQTVEGAMDDVFAVRRKQPQLIFDAQRLLPLPNTPLLAVQLPDGTWWTLTEWSGGRLQVFVNPDETLSVQIAPDEQGDLSFAFTLDSHSPAPTLPCSLAPTHLRFDGARFILQTQSLLFTVARNLGGLPVRMEVRKAEGNGQKAVLVGAELYSDYGIYPEHDEGGMWRSEGERRMVRTVGRASLCRVPDRVQLLPNGVAFEGALSSSWGGHWWHLSPRVSYSLGYETDGDAVVVHASVSPIKTLRRIRAFLAMMLTFVGVEKVVINTVKGKHEVSELGERDWQSRQLPLSPDNPQIRLHTKAGVIVLDSISRELQNCFVLKDGDRCTVFFAWLDGEPTDFAATEHPLRLRIAIEP